MKDSSHSLKSYEVVAEILNKMLRLDRAVTVEAYCQEVVELYIAHTPDDKRDISFYVGQDAIRNNKNNAQIISRAIQLIHSDSEKTKKTSILQIIELQTSLILAMVEPYKTECIQRLFAQLDMLPFPVPKLESREHQLLFSKYIQATGDVISTFGSIMENQSIDEGDAIHKTEMVARLTTLKTLCDEVLSEIHKNVPDNKLREVKPKGV